jgi:hypothetical protein
MAVMPADAQPTALTPERRRPGLALLVALLATAPYAVGIGLPYYANGVHRRAELPLYAYDLHTLWPYDTALGGVLSFVTVVGVPTVPFVSAGVALWSVFATWSWRRTLTPWQVVLYAAAAVVAVASIAWLATPTGTELVAWSFD